MPFLKLGTSPSVDSRGGTLSQHTPRANVGMHPSSDRDRRPHSRLDTFPRFPYIPPRLIAPKDRALDNGLHFQVTTRSREMDYADYVSDISFRFLQPDRWRPKGFRALNMLLRSIGIHLEVANTRLPEKSRETRRRLKQVLRLPRMSTYAIGAMINRGVAEMPAGRSFVNIGVWNGFTFFAGLAGNDDKKCIGVDNFSHKNSPRTEFLQRFEEFSSPNHEFHERDFRDYFAEVHRGPIGFYVFDGPHLYNDQLDGLMAAEPYFAEDCIILVDDTNWEQVGRANLAFMAGSTNDYRLLLDQQTPKSGHPTFWNGVMIMQLQGKNRLAKSPETQAA